MPKRKPLPMPKCVLVWKDGRREATSHGGAIYIHRPWTREDGRLIETIFRAGHIDEHADVWEYHEEKEKDVTREVRLSEARRRVERAYESGVALPRWILQGKYLGETDKEFEERLAILRPAVEGTRQSGTGEGT